MRKSEALLHLQQVTCQAPTPNHTMLMATSRQHRYRQSPPVPAGHREIGSNRQGEATTSITQCERGGSERFCQAYRHSRSIHRQVVSNCLPGQLEGVAETIWVPLFQDSANSEESTRNVAAACLGKLTTTNPSRYLPQLQVACDFFMILSSL